MGNNSNKVSIVYLTINLKNWHIYIGVHDTEEPTRWDFYLGDGVFANKPSTIAHPKEPFHYAVKKYGFESFRRITLAVFDTREEALWLEGILVNERFLKRDDVYNITLGGGAPPILTKAVYQYDENGNFIAEYESVTNAAKINNTNGSSITNAIMYKTMSAKSFWTEYKIDKLEIENFNNTNTELKVYAYTSTGDFIKEYSSISETAKTYKTSLAVIQRAIKSQTMVHKTYFSLEKLDSFKKQITQRHYRDPIHQYSMEGEYIQTFNSISDVVKQLGKKYDHISTAIKTQSSCGGYQWSWDKIDRMPNRATYVSQARKVGQFTLDGKLIKTYNTVRECRKDFGNVSRVLKGQVKACKGYTFKYVD